MNALFSILLQTQSSATNIYAIITPFALGFMMLEISELIRIPLTLICVLAFNLLGLPITFGIVLTAVIPVLCTVKYFRLSSNELVTN